VSSGTIHRFSCRELALKSLDTLPPFSPVFNHLIASLAYDNVSLAELSTVIERDTVLSGNVLRLVNSVLYGRRGTISSVRHALAIIGLTKLRNYVLGLSVSQLWKRVRTAPSWSSSRFNHHSAATAVMGDLLVQRVRVESAEAAFAAGLLHDIGRFMIAVALPDEHERIVAMMQRGEGTVEQCEFDVIDVTHAELGAAALAKWNLPVAIQRAIAVHHDSPVSPAAQREGAPISLPMIVHAANQLADHFGYSIIPLESERAPSSGEVFEELGLSKDAEHILADFENEVHSLLQAI